MSNRNSQKERLEIIGTNNIQKYDSREFRNWKQTPDADWKKSSGDEAG